jgi:hypothetical protein
VIRELLEATPPPPPDETDIDALLYAFDVICTARQEILDAMAAGPVVISDEDRALSEMLVARDAAWTATLAQAKTAVGQARMATKQLRRYAPTDARDL